MHFGSICSTNSFERPREFLQGNLFKRRLEANKLDNNMRSQELIKLSFSLSLQDLDPFKLLIVLLDFLICCANVSRFSRRKTQSKHHYSRHLNRTHCWVALRFVQETLFTRGILLVTSSLQTGQFGARISVCYLEIEKFRIAVLRIPI